MLFVVFHAPENVKKENVRTKNAKIEKFEKISFFTRTETEVVLQVFLTSTA